MNYQTLCSRVYITTFIACLNLLLVISISTKSPSYNCSPSKYRTADGSCNNIRHPDWGISGRSYSTLFSSALRSVHGDKFNNVTFSSETSDEIHRRPDNSKRNIPNSFLGFWAELLRLDLHQPSVSDSSVNEATAYIDASFLYGTSSNTSNLFIRNEPRGKISVHLCDICTEISDVNRLIYHTLVKEHNRLAGMLFIIYPDWSSELLYEEARRILIAEIQHITYEEFIPALIGAKYSKRWNLHTQDGYYVKGYNSSKMADVYSGFTAAVLDVLPATLQSTLNAYSFDELNRNISLILNTVANDPLSSFDKGNARTVTQIGRSDKNRELSDYEEVRSVCGIDNQSDSSHFSNQNNIHFSDLLLNYLNNVNVLVDGLLEQPSTDGLFGSLLSCLAAYQFSLLRDSDRFWYENDLQLSSYSEEQLNELHRVTLSGLLCGVMNNLQIVQQKAFYVKDEYFNKEVPCSLQPTLNLVSWKRESSRRTEFQDVENFKYDLLRQAIRKAEDDINRRKQTEFLLWSNTRSVDPKSPAGIAAAFSKPNRNALLLANNSILFEYASNELLAIIRERSKRRRRQLIDSDDTIISVASDFENDFLQDLDVSKILPNIFQGSKPSCPLELEACNQNYAYRSYTGFCNNQRNPDYGRSLSVFNRLLPSVYENGISKPRQTSVTGLPLPSARLVSSTIHIDISHLHSKYTLMVMQFAQFVDHDITFTPVQRGFFASIPDCRACDSALTVHPDCMPIQVPIGDSFYPQFNSTNGQKFCLPFMRSLPGQQKLGSREQINQNSAFLDASQVYGENACSARDLRTHSGLLNYTVSPYGDKDLLPTSPSHPECKAASGYCFIAGDGRASEQAALTAIHTTFMREHNRLANGLRLINPHWDEERLFQQARRILIAEYQHAVYNEFLPRILGPDMMVLYNLKLENHGYFKGYSENCNPAALTEFATAAFRIGHSILRPHLPRMSPTYRPIEPYILLRDTFFNPDIINQRHMIDELLRGLSATPIENLDTFITAEITNHLFEDKRVPHSGMDLPALNVQRARDHGVPSYNDYRTMCGIKRAVTWNDFQPELPADVISRLQRVYTSVDDVDLFPAGISEVHVKDGLVGPTFACIIGLQFRQLRTCDRFWYETADPLLRFTESQLAEIRKSSLAKIICDNLDILGPIQRSILDLPSDQNLRLPCELLSHVNLGAWKESTKGCQIFDGSTVAVGTSYLPTPCMSCICTQEGVRCSSIRVTDCFKLIQQAGRNGVLNDEICMSQCGSYLIFKSQEFGLGNDLLTSTSIKGRQLDVSAVAGLKPPPPQTPIIRTRRPSARPLRFRDLASVVIG